MCRWPQNGGSTSTESLERSGEDGAIPTTHFQVSFDDSNKI